MTGSPERQRSRRLFVTLLLGFASGLPLALSAGTLTYFLARAEVDVTTIGLFGLVATPYTWKFLWAALFDLSPPGPFAALGKRRGWLALIQLGLVCAIVATSSVDPRTAPWTTALGALFIAFFSASQDVVVDALRVESLSLADQGWGAALTQWGYRVGMIASTFGALHLADHASFRTVYGVMAALAALSVLGTALAVEPTGDPNVTATVHAPAQPFVARVLSPLRSIATRQPIGLLVAFLVVFRLGDAWAGQLTSKYLVDTGFTGGEIANVTKLIGVLATMGGVGLGGFMLSRVDARRALPLGAFIMAASNLGYAWLATQGHDTVALAVAVCVENVTSGIGGAITIAFLSSLCDRGSAATQYALLTALLSASRTTLSAASGFVRESCDALAAAFGVAGEGWAVYFALTAVAGVPGLGLSFLLARRVSPRVDDVPA